MSRSRWAVAIRIAMCGWFLHYVLFYEKSQRKPAFFLPERSHI